MKITNNTNDIRAYINMVYDNNPFGTVERMRSAGIVVDGNEREEVIKEKLFGYFLKDKSVFLELMKTVNYSDNADNYTTSINFRKAILDYNKVTKEQMGFSRLNDENSLQPQMLNIGGFFDGINDFVSDSETTTSTTTTTTVPQNKEGEIPWGAIGLVALVLVSIWMLIKMNR